MNQVGAGLLFRHDYLVYVTSCTEGDIKVNKTNTQRLGDVALMMLYLDSEVEEDVQLSLSANVNEFQQIWNQLHFFIITFSLIEEEKHKNE